MREVILTSGAGGRILTNCHVWSPDNQWLVYDTRSDPAGSTFDGSRIEAIHIHTREIRLLYTSRNGAHCGVASWHPQLMRVAFIVGPEHPTADWTYAAARRQGVYVDWIHPGVAVPIDARDLIAPFTLGALRGGSHVHIWHADGTRLSFTYEDHVLEQLPVDNHDHDGNQRTIGVSWFDRPVVVPRSHQRNHDGAAYSTLVVKTTARPRPGSDELLRAYEEAWIGNQGYIRSGGSRQHYALAFQGEILTESLQRVSEVFVVDIPLALDIPGKGLLQGSETRQPTAPLGTTQRRLTHTTQRKFPGIQGPRHWLRSSPDGEQIAFLMKDDSGIVQLWTISPRGGEPRQITHEPESMASAFTWFPDSRRIAIVVGTQISVIDVATGMVQRLTAACDPALAPRPEACVVSRAGNAIAFVRNLPNDQGFSNQIAIISLD